MKSRYQSLNRTTRPGMAFAASLLLGNSVAQGQGVWNVNIGTQVTVEDDYLGAASENIPNSFWNSVTPDAFANLQLADATGSTDGAPILTLSPPAGLTLGFRDTELTTGDEIFIGWMKTDGNSQPFDLLLQGLDSTATYDFIIYSDWFWDNGNSGLPVTLTAGSGLEGTFFVNRDANNDARGLVGPLLEDEEPANQDVGKTNYHRFTALTPDETGDLAFSIGGVNGPFNGFQLIQVGGGGADLAITAISYLGGESPTVTLTWPKTGAGSYRVKSSLDLIGWEAGLDTEVLESADENTGDPDNITVTLPLADGLELETTVFFRVEE